MNSYSSSIIKVQKDSSNPIDTVQCIVWDPRDLNTFYTGGWDGIARTYRIQGSPPRQIVKRWQYFFHHPIITMQVTNNEFLFVGLATGQIGIINLKNNNDVMVVGQHDAPLCKIIWIQKYQTLITFGFDNLIKIFNMGNNNQNGNFQINQYKLAYKTNTVAFHDPYILVGTQEGKIAIFYYDKLANLKFQNQYHNIFDESHGIVKFSCSAIHGKSSRIVFGCSDGRIFITTFSENSSGFRILKPSCYRSQKKKEYRKQFFGLVNAVEIGFKDGRNEFIAFCGTSEHGTLHPDKATKIKGIGSEATVTALSLSPDNQYYAFAYGCDWCKGLEEISNYSPVRIFAGKVTSSDISISGYSSSNYMR